VKRKIGKFCETFKTQKIERENMHVIENWVWKMKHKWQYKPISKKMPLEKTLTFDTPSFYYCDCNECQFFKKILLSFSTHKNTASLI
jgi:hypothetical protein